MDCRQEREHVANIWQGLRRGAPEVYTLTRLIDSRRRQKHLAAGDSRHIICDIDKTYLETEFESLVRMARIAFEAATDKVTVTGASEVLLAARWGAAARSSAAAPEGYPRALHFVSSSPPQLRAVLEEKLMMDGLDWDSDTFKNQAYNIRMRRMDLLRQHVAYKSLAILNIIQSAPAPAIFYMLGDNAESDAYIYTGIKLFLDRRLSRAGYARYLEIAGVEKPVVEEFAQALSEEPAGHVEAILIRSVPGYEFIEAPPLTDLVRVFDNFFEAALVLMVHQLISGDCLWELARSFHNHYGVSRAELVAAMAAVRQLAPPDLGPYLDEVSDRLGIKKIAKAVHPFAKRLALDLTPSQALSEDEILKHATVWMDKLKESRRKD